MVRAVFEGVAFNTRWLLGAVERFAGKPFDSLAFIGGGAGSDLWAQIHADVTGRPSARWRSRSWPTCGEPACSP